MIKHMYPNFNNNNVQRHYNNVFGSRNPPIKNTNNYQLEEIQQIEPQYIEEIQQNEPQSIEEIQHNRTKQMEQLFKNITNPLGKKQKKAIKFDLVIMVAMRVYMFINFF